MAKATKHEVKPTTPPYTVTLELSREEAEGLRSLLNLVSGEGEWGYQVWEALLMAGVQDAHIDRHSIEINGL